MQKPYISFIFLARNDNHCEGFVERFQNSLDVLGYLNNKYKMDSEIIIVEWNPLPGQPGLREVLKFDKCLNSIVKIITVPYEIHKDIPPTPFDAVKSDEITFFQNIALNAGARRANGDFVLCTNADIIFNEETASYFAKKKLSEKFFYRTYRYDVESVIPESFSVDQALEFCKTNSSLRGSRVQKGKLHRKAAGDFFLIARKNFEKIRGYAEIKCDGLKIDSDILDSARRYFKQVILEGPMLIYHQYHVNRYNKAYDRELHVRKDFRETYKQTKGFINKIIIKIYKRRKNPNKANWGLVNHVLPEVAIQE